MQRIPASYVRDQQEAIRAVGQSIEYVPLSGASRAVVARVRYASDAELANAIENYRLVVTCDARQFPSPPLKGDSMMIDGARRGVMWVREIRASGALISYQCGVQG